MSGEDKLSQEAVQRSTGGLVLAHLQETFPIALPRGIRSGRAVNYSKE